QKPLLSPEDLEAIGLTKPSGWNSWQDFSLFVGGPIIKDRIWFFTNARRFEWVRDFNHIIWADTQAAGGRVYTLDEAPHKENNIFGKLTFQLASNIRFLATYNLTMITEDFYTNRIGSNLDVTSTTKWDGETGHTFSGQLNWVASQNLFFDIRAGYIRRFFPIPYSDQAISDAPQHYDRYYTIYRNNPRFEETYLRTRLNPSVQATLFVDNALGGSHEWKFGVEYEATSGSWDWWRENPFRIYYYQGGPSYPTSTEPNRYRIYSYICGPSEGSSVQENEMRRIGAFVQDSFTIGEKLTLNLGVRFDTSTGKFPEQFKAASADPYGLLATLGDSPFSEYTIPAMDVLTWTHFSPRIGFAYDPFGDGKTSIKGSWSRYNEYLMIQYYSLANPNYPNSGGWYWYDDNENGVIDPNADRFLSRYLPPDPFTFELEEEVNTDASAPYTDEFAIGVEREVAKDFSAGVTFVYKHKQNIFEDVNDYGLGQDEAWKGFAENSPYWERFDFLDPGDDGEFGTADDQQSYCYVELADAPAIHYFMTNVDGAFRKYWALQFVFHKRMSNNWQMMASYVYSKAWGNIGGNYGSSYGASGGFDTPNAFVFNGGRLDYDRPHNIKIQSTVILPYEFILSGYFNHHSGSPWNRDVTVYLPDNSRYKWEGDYYSVDTELNGTRRNAPVTTLDMRVEKRFRIGETFSIGAYLDIINLMGRSGFDITGNPGGYVHYDYENDPDHSEPWFERYGTYGDISGAYGNRVYKISVRFTF
ncbi:MAG: TonB-dependent receptor, partial [Candidatus Aminicenantes bacterium]